MSRTHHRFILGTALLVCLVANAQDTPTRVELSERAESVAEVSSKVKAKVALDPAAVYVVEGRKLASTWWIGAKEIIFKKGAVLEFPGNVTKESRELFIVAGKITLEDPSSPAVITWSRPSPPAPPPPGQASNGAPGGGHGAGGAPGAGGPPGVGGIEGSGAPTLTLIARTYAAPLRIDFRGAPGGQGGQGYRGGDGGAGAQGGPARQARSGGPFNTTIWHPWCESGPGQGGAGGRGGDGGIGGTGGKGGVGGSVTLVGVPSALPTITQAVRVDVTGGPGGEPGAPGAPGNGGAGGPEGQLANFCNSAGRHGAAGAGGNPGGAGKKGEMGNAGRVYVAEIQAELFASLFGF